MQLKRIVFVSLPVGLLALSGCETTGGGSNQFESTVYDTHRRVVQLDKNLGDTVNQLQTATADLTARVDESDTEMKRLRSVAEENQVRLDRLQEDLREMRATLYRHFNLSVPNEYAASTVRPGSAGSVIVEPPRDAFGGDSEESGLTADVILPTDRPTVPVPQAPAGDPDDQYRRAQRSYANENYEEALKLFDEFLQLYPNSELASNAQFWKAKTLLDLGQYDPAIREFQILRSAYPSSTKVPFAMHNQAVAYSRIGQIDQAKSVLREVIENYPASPAADQARSALDKLGG